MGFRNSVVITDTTAAEASAEDFKFFKNQVRIHSICRF